MSDGLLAGLLVFFVGLSVSLGVMLVCVLSDRGPSVSEIVLASAVDVLRAKVAAMKAALVLLPDDPEPHAGYEKPWERVWNHAGDP